jgi:hypothetical protein
LILPLISAVVTWFVLPRTKVRVAVPPTVFAVAGGAALGLIVLRTLVQAVWPEPYLVLPVMGMVFAAVPLAPVPFARRRSSATAGIVPVGLVGGIGCAVMIEMNGLGLPSLVAALLGFLLLTMPSAVLGGIAWSGSVERVAPPAQWPAAQWTPDQQQVAQIAPGAVGQAAFIGPQRRNGLATGSFICAVLGVSVPAVILGHMALNQINKSGGQESGRGLAMAGLIIGYLAMVLSLVVTIVLVVAVANTGY